MVEKLTNVTLCSNSRRIGTLHILKTFGPILQHKWIMLKMLFCHTSGKSAVHKIYPKSQMALCIFDVFRAQIGEDFLDFLSENNVRVVYVQCPSAKI